MGDDMTGAALLREPRANKGTAFTAQERNQLGLERLLPAAVDTLDMQVHREFIFDRGEARVERPRDIRAWLEAMTYKPTYDGKAA